MKHIHRIRNVYSKILGEQAFIALFVVILAAMAGLFSSCTVRNMHDQSVGQTADGTTATPTPMAPTAGNEVSEEEQTSGPGMNNGPMPVETGSVSPLPDSVPRPDESPSGKPKEQPGTPEPTEEGKPAPNPPPKPPAKPSPSPEPAPSEKPEPSPKPAPSAEPAPGDIVNPYVRYTWDQMMDEAKKLRDAYPEWIELASAGTSVEGRDLLVIRLGKGDRKILLCGAHHAREYISSSYLMKMVEVYADKADKDEPFGDFRPRELLSRVTIVVVPMVNPDGVNLVNNGLQAVSDQEAVAAMVMVNPSYRHWKANINGVDLNRQYPALWEEKYDDVGQPASENYKGTASATEPEVQAMMALARSEDFVLSASFHAKGEVIYWADRGTVNTISGARDIARRMGRAAGYALMPVSEEPSVYAAGFENWFRLEFKRPSFCIELTPYNNTEEPHDDKKFDSLVWNKAKTLGLILADEALKR